MSTTTTVEIDHEKLREALAVPISFADTLCRAVHDGDLRATRYLHDRFGVTIKHEVRERDMRELCDRVYREVGVTTALRRAYKLGKQHQRHDPEESE